MIENPMCFKKTGITGYSISLAVSVKRLTNDSIQMVRVMILCGEFVGVCTAVGFIECSNKLVHCIGLQFGIVLPITYWLVLIVQTQFRNPA